MKKVFAFFIVCVFVSACNSDDIEFCSVDNPTVDLAWLTAEIEQREQNITQDSKYLYISRSTHNGQPIIIYADCCPTCNSVYVVYNCMGEIIGFIGDGNFSLKTLSSGKVIWKTDDNACSF